MSQLIFLKPKGGLGNQLFQLSAALTFKALGGQLFIFPTANKHSGRDYRPLFDGQAIDTPMITEHTYFQTNAFEAFDPKQFPYTSITLDGYFQNYPSIKSAIPAIRTLFTQNPAYKGYQDHALDIGFLGISWVRQGLNHVVGKTSHPSWRNWHFIYGGCHGFLCLNSSGKG
jgi:hypothetical protein